MRLSHVKSVGVIGLCVVLTAVLLVLALPLGGFGWLAPVVFVPLLRAVRNRGFLAGFLASVVSLCFAAYLSSTGVFYQHSSPEGNVAWIYIAYFTFGFADCITVAISADRSIGKFPAWWFAAFAVAMESVLLVTMPSHLGICLYESWLSMRLAALGGIWLLSFLLWYSNFWLARSDLKGTAWYVVPILLGLFAERWVQRPTSTDGLSIGIIQAPTDDEESLRTLHAGTVSDLNVWPEFGGIMFLNGTDDARLKELSKSSPLVTSFPDRTSSPPFNVAVLFDRGNASDKYAKRKLFGAESNQHQPGSRAVSVPFRELRLGLNICFDSCYPSIIRDTAFRSELIALPTIDPQSPHHFLAAMHAAYTPIRAAETGRAIIRADGLAYSMVADGYGGILTKIEPGKVARTVKIGSNRMRAFAPALWVRDGVLYVCIGAVIVGIVFRRRLTAHQQSNDRETRAGTP